MAIAESKYHTIDRWDECRDGMFNIIVDAWWCVDDEGNPLFYDKYNHPQCNQNLAITERLARGRAVKQIPVVYVPVRIQDYVD